MEERSFSIANSNKIYERAKGIIPGESQTFSKGVSQFVNGFAPKYLKRGKGAYVWDVDDNKFIEIGLIGAFNL